jgi:hypothetical protein
MPLPYWPLRLGFIPDPAAIEERHSVEAQVASGQQGIVECGSPICGRPLRAAAIT